MSSLRLTAALACVGAAVAGQIPLYQSATPQAVGSTLERPLISSSALQGDIDAKHLLVRAKQLSKIADLGIDEYNHPTRVIGSKGMWL